MKLIPISEAARLLGVDPDTLRRHETPDGYLEIYGYRIRVYRLSPSPNARRRYDEREIYRVLSKMAREKGPGEGPEEE